MRVLFVHMNYRSFQEVDLRLLRERWAVDAVDFKWTRHCIIKLVRALRRCDLVFGWFASHHTFLPALLGRWLRKRVIIAAADYDLANEPWFAYGSMRPGVRRLVNNSIFEAADRVLVPSLFSRSLALKNTVLRDMPDKVRVIPLGFDAPEERELVKQRVLTTVGDLNSYNWIRKGHREFVALAERIPDVQCYLVGQPHSDDFRQRVLSSRSNNLELTGRLTDEALDDLLARSAVYAQLSYLEGFGCSVAEAMLRECVPAVTRCGALPEVVGDCGFYAQYGDIERARDAVCNAFDNPGLGLRGRERILDCFSMDRRRQALAEIVQELR